MNESGQTNVIPFPGAETGNQQPANLEQELMQKAESLSGIWELMMLAPNSKLARAYEDYKKVVDELARTKLKYNQTMDILSSNPRRMELSPEAIAQIHDHVQKLIADQYKILTQILIPGVTNVLNVLNDFSFETTSPELKHKIPEIITRNLLDTGFEGLVNKIGINNREFLNQHEVIRNILAKMFQTLDAEKEIRSQDLKEISASRVPDIQKMIEAFQNGESYYTYRFKARDVNGNTLESLSTNITEFPQNQESESRQAA